MSSYTYRNFVVRITTIDNSQSIVICDHSEDIELDTDSLVFWNDKFNNSSISEAIDKLKEILCKQIEKNNRSSSGTD